jgi:hypothetical protein
VSDASLVPIAQRCRGLVTLTCCFCPGVTDATLTALSHVHGAPLQELNIGYNHAVTLNGMLKLLTACRGMRTVYCLECGNLTEGHIAFLRDRFPLLRINPDLTGASEALP